MISRFRNLGISADFSHESRIVKLRGTTRSNLARKFAENRGKANFPCYKISIFCAQNFRRSGGKNGRTRNGGGVRSCRDSNNMSSGSSGSIGLWWWYNNSYIVQSAVVCTCNGRLFFKSSLYMYYVNNISLIVLQPFWNCIEISEFCCDSNVNVDSGTPRIYIDLVISIK